MAIIAGSIIRVRSSSPNKDGSIECSLLVQYFGIWRGLANTIDAERQALNLINSSDHLKLGQ